jgi:drug/metabolite transporter (DMT)-like permease
MLLAQPAFAAIPYSLNSGGHILRSPAVSCIAGFRMADIAVLDTREKVFAGIMLTSLAYFLFSTQDAVIKLLVSGISVWQIMAFRSAIILVGAGCVGGPKLFAEAARSPILKAMVLRSLLTMVAWLCFYNAARYLQLAELTTIYFAAPIIVTVLSIVLLKEVVPPSRWLAVLIGFAGVFVACDPRHMGFSPPVLMVLAAACFWALTIVLIRKIALLERSIIQLVLNNAFFLVFSALPLFWVWQTPNGWELVLLLSVGTLGGVAQFLLFEGMRRAPVSIIAPFEYTALLWAFIFGYLIWGDVPRTEVFIGAAIIISAGLIILAGERWRRA